MVSCNTVKDKTAETVIADSVIDDKALIPAIPLLENLLGYYVDDKDIENNVELLIIKDAHEYKYILNTGKRVLKGNVGTPDTNENTQDELYILLEGIRWDYWGIDGEIGEDSPEGISVLVNGDELIIQNYGSAMNDYIKLSDIDKKYIELVKRDE